MNNSSEICNASRNSPPECPYEQTSPAGEWLKTIVYLILLLFALFGNTLVICVVYKHRRMQTATNYLIVNMAVGDLFMAIFSMIPTATSMFRGSHTWVSGGPFGQISCKLLLFSQGTSMACSIITLTALAFERYFAVAFPLWKVVTPRRTKWLVAFIWSASIASTSPILYAAGVQLFDGAPYCIEDWAPAFDPKRAPAIYTIVSFVLLYALPLIVISVLYSMIIAKVWGRHIPGHTTPANARLFNKSKKNVLKMLMTVVVAFALSWFLMHFIFLLNDFSDVFPNSCIPVALQTTGFLFGHANSAINCCIYVIFSQDFRRGFKEFLRPLFPMRSGTLVFESTRGGTIETTQSSHKDRPQTKSFKAIENTTV